MRFHIVKAAMLEDDRPLIFIDGCLEESRYPADFTRHVGLQIGKMHKQQVREVANFPPAANVRPPGPQGMAVTLKPGKKKVANRFRRPLERRPDSSRRI